MNHLLFSYGTLQSERVQLDNYGRKLEGHKDQLPGYRLEQVEIKDERVLSSSGEKFHPIAVPSNNDANFIEGTVFEITEAELQQSDAYEVDDYKRVKVKLSSGKEAWVYIKA